MREPGYLALFRSGELEERTFTANAHLHRCDLCAQECRVDRFTEKLGVCQTGNVARVSSYGPHMGEEAVLSGWRGSGTIFFTRCNMRCQYCQNYEISQTNAGELAEPARLAAIMLELQDHGCHNINLVTPSHVVAQILSALVIASRQGLHLPLVYNTGGYDSLASLSLLNGVIDIYMPDMKYASVASGRMYSKTARYPQVNRAAVLEMHRQVGDLIVDENGLASRGLLVRCLTLPFGLAGTAETAKFLAEEISPNTAVNLMDQYKPAYNAHRYSTQFPKLKRPITPQEQQAAVEMARTAGLHRIIQI
jgi:putative pyruvate formate lyase activating enzyme